MGIQTIFKHYSDGDVRLTSYAFYTFWCSSVLGEPIISVSALSQARRGPSHPVTVMFYTPRGRAAIRNPWP